MEETLGKNVIDETINESVLLKRLRDMDLDDLIIKTLEGRRFWLDNHLDNKDFVLLLYDEQSDLKQIFVNLFLKKVKEGYTEGVILTTTVPKEIEQKNYLLCKKYDMDHIVQLYLLYEFTDKLIIGSLEKPVVSNLSNFLKYMGMSRRDIIYKAMFSF